MLDRLWRGSSAHRILATTSGTRTLMKPLQQPRPPIMNAGNSDVGQRWAARHSDIKLSRAGADGLNMTFVNYQDELGRVVGQMIPLLEQAGLRKRTA